MKRILLSSLIALTAVFCAQAQPAGWNYSLAINVYNPGGANLYGYTVKVYVPTSALVTANQMQPTGSDIRFGYPCTGTTLYNFFIDSAMNSGLTKFYVQIDTLDAQATRTIYMFFGNPSAPSASAINPTMFTGGPFTILNNYAGNGGPGATPGQFGYSFTPNQSILVTAMGKRTPQTNGSDMSRPVTLFTASSTTTGVVQRQVVATSTNATWGFIPLSYANSNPLEQPKFFQAGTNCVLTLYDTFNVLPYQQRYQVTRTLISSYLPPQIPYASIQGKFRTAGGTTSTTFPTSFTSTYIYGYPDLQFYTFPNVVPAPVATPVGGSVTGITGQPQDITACIGSNATFTVIASGSNAHYQWYVDSGAASIVPGWDSVKNVGNYSGAQTTNLTIFNCNLSLHSFSFRVYVSTTCGAGYSLPAMLSINTTTVFTTPLVTMTGPNPACSFVNSVYIANTNVNHGTYQWVLNGNVVNTTDTFHAFHPSSGDQLYVTVTVPANGAYGCYTAPQAVSGLAVITVENNIIPVDSVFSNKNSICDGTQVNFTAQTNVVGGTYQWQVNNVNVGSNLPSYAYVPQSGDQVKCIVYTPSNGCYGLPFSTSPSVVITTITNITPIIIIAGPGLADSGDVVTITATTLNAGSNYYILWYRNNILFDSTTVDHISFVKGGGVDNIRAKIVPESNEALQACYATATSATVSVVANVNAVKNVAVNRKVSVSPNPFDQQLIVMGMKKGDKVCLYDLAGRVVSDIWSVDNNNTQQQFAVSNIASGTYLLRIMNDNGNTVANIPVQKLK